MWKYVVGNAVTANPVSLSFVSINILSIIAQSGVNVEELSQ